MTEKKNETRRFFFEKRNNIYKPSSTFIKKKKKKSTWERAQMNKIRFKTEITIEIKDIQRVIKSLLLSHVWLFATPWTAVHQASLSFTISWSLPKLMSIEYVMPSSHFILCHSFLSLPSIIPSIRVFSNESTLHIRWPKYWSFNVSISPSNEYLGFVSFKIDWFDLLSVQGTLKSLL